MIFFRYLLHAFAVALVCACLPGANVRAQETVAPPPGDKAPVLLELFTSQNCPSCPTANKLTIALAQSENVFPLTFSVDYWDYLGWEDTAALPEFAERQRDYADLFMLRGPYTPQSIVNGRVQMPGTRYGQLLSTINSLDALPRLTIPVALTRDHYTLTSALAGKLDTQVWLVGYIPGMTDVRPTGGGNPGRLMRHINMATSVRPLGDWDGEPREGNALCSDPACVLLVQDKASGAVIALATTDAG